MCQPAASSRRRRSASASSDESTRSTARAAAAPTAAAVRTRRGATVRLRRGRVVRVAIDPSFIAEPRLRSPATFASAGVRQRPDEEAVGCERRREPEERLRLTGEARPRTLPCRTVRQHDARGMGEQLAQLEGALGTTGRLALERVENGLLEGGRDVGTKPPPRGRVRLEV